ncbi:MAG TPA: hypothetical protein VNV38_15205 [Stellaceae bacterium]|jgi:hypothetical protein|nr:hypothetical protein [Stellaceae bacterium]
MSALTVVAFRPQADAHPRFVFHSVIDGICRMKWDELNSDEVMRVATAYYFFSVQFRESLEVARDRHPDDEKLAELWEGECDTDNLSPWPGIAAAGERMNHDEFMRRVLELHPAGRDRRLIAAGLAYLQKTRALDPAARAASIASYEDGGLSSVFGAMLRAPHWYGAGQRAFRFFLEEHIRFDSDDGAGHGQLSRHLPADDRVLPLWTLFRDLLVSAVPRLALVAAVTRRQPRAPVFMRRGAAFDAGNAKFTG